MMTGNKLAKYWADWYKNPANKTQRFGQYVCNQENIQNPEIFYEKDKYKAYNMLVDLINKNNIE